MNCFNDKTTTGIADYTNYCWLRLPCGICERTNSMCPLVGNARIEPTWHLPDITCQSTTESDIKYKDDPDYGRGNNA